MKSEYQNHYGQSEDESPSMNEEFERFELLSAYLDGEVTAEERYQVQEWLDTDPKLKQTYLKLLRLQQVIPQIPTPSPSITTEQLSARVFQQIKRENRVLRLWIWGGMVTASAGFLVFFNLFMGTNNIFRPSIQSASLEIESEPLVIALNQPIFDIPVEQ
jgi:anti-sigma factor RsiW